MTQPDRDVPDPLQPPASAPAGTDDLLAQMAGDEINRLLANAQVEPPAAAASGTGTPDASPYGNPPRPADADPAEATALDLVGAGDDDDVPAVPLTDASMSQELDLVFDRQVSEAGLPAGPSARPSPPVAAPPAARRPAAPEVEAELEEDGPVAAAQMAPARAAIAEDPGRAAAPAAVVTRKPVPAGPAQVPPAAAPDSPRRRRLVRWAMFPLDPFPAGVRDAVGKVAIVTTLNAIAVLIYVLLFR